MMTALGPLAAVAACLAPGALLAFLAVPHFLDGIALDAAIPVPAYMITHHAMPNAAYRDAADVLAQVNPRDGDGRIARAEAALHAGAPRQFAIGELRFALMDAPASARGWTLLAEAWMRADGKNAATALSQALVLAPDDYWLAGPRAWDAARLWQFLDPDSQRRALAQTRLLWEEPLLRPQLRMLLTSSDGVALAARAFADNQDELRDMNRWLSAERRRAPLQPAEQP